MCRFDQNIPQCDLEISWIPMPKFIKFAEYQCLDLGQLTLVKTCNLESLILNNVIIRWLIYITQPA